jgi:hypothetical protein
MRFLSRGWADGDLSEQECDRARAEYAARLDEIWERLPSSMRKLAREVSLHDAVIERVVWTPASKELLIVLVAGTRERGYQGVSLTYRGALLGPRRVESLRRAAMDRETEVLYDEVDIDDGGLLVHRILFWPREEVTVDFQELELAVEARADRRAPLGGAFIERLPEDEA